MVKRKLVILVALILALFGGLKLYTGESTAGLTLLYAEDAYDKCYCSGEVTITVKGIEGKDQKGEVLFRGHVMAVNEPGAVKVAMAKGGPGNLQTTSGMAAEAGAVAAVNGGGFFIRPTPGKPLFYPLYYTVQDGQLVSQVSRHSSEILVGLTGKGTLVGGTYAGAAAIKKAGIMEGVSFQPQLIKNGEGLHKPGGAAHPRTAVGQKKDGTLIFVVIDGRRPGWSAGVTLHQLQEVLLEMGAYNAFNLDGGGSSSMVFQNQVLNKPSDSSGERCVATSLLLMGTVNGDDGGNGGNEKPPTSDPPAGANVVVNPGFENGKQGWQGSAVAVEKSETNYYASAGYTWKFYQDVAVTPGKTYTFTAGTRKGTAGSQARVVVGYWDADKFKALRDIKYAHSGSGWENTPPVSFTVPAGVNKCRVYLLINGGSGRHYFDDIRMAA